MFYRQYLLWYRYCLYYGQLLLVVDVADATFSVYRGESVVGCWLLENYLPNPGEWVVGLPKTRLPLVFFGVIVITPPAASQLQ